MQPNKVQNKLTNKMTQPIPNDLWTQLLNVCDLHSLRQLSALTTYAVPAWYRENI